MKISLGMILKPGAWGGGNQFGHSLSSYLEKKGCFVYFDLYEPDLDIIILTDPRSNLSSSSYSHEKIIDYLKNINDKAIVVHRINECDERKKTRYVNNLLLEANKIADHTVFISSFLQDLFINQGLKSESSVILNGGKPEIFYGDDGKKDFGNGPTKIVTHHWGGSYFFEELAKKSLIKTIPLRVMIHY
tara:strand:+ start:373 stop:939 length:567 start_codon:yes stop_codon:yes gene_type:complete